VLLSFTLWSRYSDIVDCPAIKLKGTDVDGSSVCFYHAIALHLVTAGRCFVSCDVRPVPDGISACIFDQLVKPTVLHRLLIRGRHKILDIRLFFPVERYVFDIVEQAVVVPVLIRVS
jgi:hypothetical protein